MENTILPLITEFWSGLGITITDINVEIIGDDVNIRVETPDSAILIGMHGKNIAIFQHLLSRMIDYHSKHFVHVHLEINNYMKIKDEKFIHFIDSKISLISSNGHSIRIGNITPYERKKAHNYIAERHIPGLSTQSEGEGDERVLILSYTGKIDDVSTSLDIPPGKDNLLISDDGIGI